MDISQKKYEKCFNAVDRLKAQRNVIETKIENRAGFFWFFCYFPRVYRSCVIKYQIDKIIRGNIVAWDRPVSAAHFIVALGFPIYWYQRYLASKKWSPFIKEWFWDSFQTGYAGPIFLLFFLCMFFIFSGGRVSISLWFELLLPLFKYIILLMIVVFIWTCVQMSTAMKEIFDNVQRYPVKTENLAIGSFESFRTSAFDSKTGIPTTRINALDPYGDGKYPTLCLCCPLSENGEKGNLIGQGFIVTSYAYAELDRGYNILTNNTDMTSSRRKIYQKSLKMLLSEEAVVLLNELIDIMPTMEFRYTYLRHSKLLVRIDPIEGYDYAEEVPALLEKLNATIHPWLKDKVKL